MKVDPEKEVWIIFDEEDPTIKKWANDIDGTLQLFQVARRLVNIQKYKAEAELVNVKASVYLVSVETEAFHTCVRKEITNNKTYSDTHLVILKHSQNDHAFMKKLLKDINKQLRKSNGNVKSSDKLHKNNNILRRDFVVPILNWENVSSWWPHVLAFIQKLQDKDKQPSKKMDKEIGAYFQLNPDSETQMNWFSDHRRTLEDSFQVKCACGDQNPNEETFIRNSKCIVLYVEESKFKRSNDLSESQKRALTQCAASKGCSTCIVFDHFQYGGNDTVDNKMAKDYSMRLEGNGMLLHWVYLMNNLGLGRCIKR